MNLIIKRQLRTAITLAGMLGIWICAAPAARATPFLYTFSIGEILTELHRSQGSSFASQGYFALFIQPDDARFVSPYTYGVLTSPKPAGIDQWEAVTVTDPFGIPSGTYAQFSKLSGQTDVTLMAGANGGIFLNGPHHSYSDAGPYPVLFGSAGTLTSLLNPTDTISFVIDTPDDVLYPHFKGYASAIFSFSPTSFTDFPVIGPGKTDFALPFDLVATPEPGTIGLMTLGAALIVLGGVRKRIHLSRNTGDNN